MTDSRQLATTQRPPLTCLCPTYGRFQRLQDAVACFIRQDYPNKRLLILNDAPRAIELGASGDAPIRVVNRSTRYPTLGHKRQALLEMAETSLVAHWDDDDLYLPWHLSQCVAELEAHPWASCAKPRAAWYAVGPPGAFALRGVRHNVFEGQMVFDRRRALELGGYPPMVSGQAKALLEKFTRAGELHTWNPARADISYIYRWGYGLHHISAGGDNPRSHLAFSRRNRDFGTSEGRTSRAEQARLGKRCTSCGRVADITGEVGVGAAAERQIDPVLRGDAP